MMYKPYKPLTFGRGEYVYGERNTINDREGETVVVWHDVIHTDHPI